MIKYIGKRILMLIPVLLGVVLLVFSMMYFSPGNAEDYILGDMATEEDKELPGRIYPYFPGFWNIWPQRLPHGY